VGIQFGDTVRSITLRVNGNFILSLASRALTNGGWLAGTMCQ